MTTSADATGESGLEREWWRRAARVLHSPRSVFAALRDDSPEAAAARQEPLTALVFVAGIAGVLATPTFGRLLDEPEIDGLVLLVLAVVAGGSYAAFGYFILGGALHFGARSAGASGDYRRSRHLLGFALAPLALSLVLWPLELALWGGDGFREGGDDSGLGGRLFGWLELAAVAWAFSLVALGLRVTYGLTWPRTALALVPVSLLGGLVVLAELVE